MWILKKRKQQLLRLVIIRFDTHGNKNDINQIHNCIKQFSGLIRLFVNSLDKMLKKASHIILSMLLLLSTTGLAISKHFCGGELISTSIFVEADSCCDDSDCCKNETEVFQLDEDYSLVTVSEVPQSVEFELLDLAILVYNFSVIETEEIQELFESDLPPPPKIQIVLSQKQSYLL